MAKEGSPTSRRPLTPRLTLRFTREEEAKKFYSKAELEMVEATAARIKKVAAEARKAKAKR